MNDADTIAKELEQVKKEYIKQKSVEKIKEEHKSSNEESEEAED
jgi:hypothetical protein